MTRVKQPQNNQLRIIAGQWRGRKLTFPNLPGLRPTTDRIRETLFNWLQADIIGARCLDLFAGSGALGFEALSRNADSVIFVDSAAVAINQIKKNLLVLNDQNGLAHQIDAVSFINTYKEEPFDLIFLDPPFNKGLLETCITALQQSKCLKSHGLIYVECEKQLTVNIPEDWSLLKEKKAGQVKYMLFEKT